MFGISWLKLLAGGIAIAAVVGIIFAGYEYVRGLDARAVAAEKAAAAEKTQLDQLQAINEQNLVALERERRDRQRAEQAASEAQALAVQAQADAAALRARIQAAAKAGDAPIPPGFADAVRAIQMGARP